MKRPLLIIVTGMPSTGKTTLANAIQAKTSFPLFSKDTLKELLFDTVGWSDRDWSKRVGVATYAILDYIIQEEMRAGHAIIVESNFKPEFDNEKFRKWQKAYNYQAVQIICRADSEVLFERFKSRAISGERHPGHADQDNLSEWREFFLKQDDINAALDIESREISIDTTLFQDVDVVEVLDEIDTITQS